MAYRHYVLLLLLLVYVHTLLSRLLPSFLVSVPTPGCEEVCSGADHAAPLCHLESNWGQEESLRIDQSFDACQDCKARVGPYANVDEKDGNFYNMRDGACISPWEYGLLMGYGFSLPFVLGSLATGQVVDSMNRVVLASVALAVWSSATFGMAYASDISAMMLSRFVVGVSQAFAVPASMSLVTGYFDAASQGSATSILSSGVCLGAGVASWTVPLAESFGWRMVCKLVGLLGLAVSVITFATVREPARPTSSKVAQTSRSYLKLQVIWLLTIATSVRLMASYTLAAYLPIYYLRAALPGYTAKLYGTVNSIIVAVSGLLSALIAGSISDLLQERYASAPAWLAVLLQLLPLPFYFGVFWADTFMASLLFYFAALLLGEGWLGLALVQVKMVVPLAEQGRAVAFVIMVATIVSSSSLAVLGALDPGTKALGYMMFVLIAGCLLATAVAFAMGSKEVGKPRPCRSRSGSRMDLMEGEQATLSTALLHNSRHSVGSTSSDLDYPMLFTLSVRPVRRKSVHFAASVPVDVWSGLVDAEVEEVASDADGSDREPGDSPRVQQPCAS